MPNGHKIFQMIIKYNNIFHSNALPNLPIWDFWFKNKPSGNPACGDPRFHVKQSLLSGQGSVHAGDPQLRNFFLCAAKDRLPSNLCCHQRSITGLPDGIFSSKKMGKFWMALLWKRLVYFMAIWTILCNAIWDILWPFGNLVAIWYSFPLFGILCQEKIWQSCSITVDFYALCLLHKSSSFAFQTVVLRSGAKFQLTPLPFTFGSFNSV
jgi:hypothetical protein